MRRLLLTVSAAALVLGACGGGSADISDVPELPPVSSADVTELLGSSELPVVLNVWASWCIPCRSEAPLLERAADEFAGEISFVGLNVRDSQSDARGFIAEFFPEAPIEHLFDQGGTIPLDLGGSRGVPLTFFYEPGGGLVTLHTGVIDERTLALQIDEIASR